MSRKKIIVTGSNGQLGREINDLQKDFSDFDFTFFDRTSLDITNQDALKQVFEAINPDYFINCAAYTAVDLAEKEDEKCFAVNDLALKYIGALCNEHQTKLVHISSDYVYHNQQTNPLTETDPTNPQGIYAKSKLAGELKVQASNCTYLILRTSWVYSSYGKNFIKTVIRLANQLENMNVVSDQIGTLTHAGDLGKAILQIIERDDPQHWNETYNYSNEGTSSWYDIAKYVVEKMNLDMTVAPIPSSDYPTPASRPFWSLMSKDKFKKAFDLPIPTWQDSLNICLSRLSK